MPAKHHAVPVPGRPVAAPASSEATRFIVDEPAAGTGDAPALRSGIRGAPPAFNRRGAAWQP